MRKQILISLIFLFFITKNNSLQAQIINIESNRLNLVDTTGWFGFIGLGANFVKNTKSVTTIFGDVRAERLWKKSRILLLTDYNLFRADKESFIDNGFQHVRFNYEINRKLEYEIFTQVQFNNQVRLKSRALIGNGLRLQVLRRANEKIYYGLAYMFEYNEVEIVDNTISFFADHRLSTYLSLSVKPFSDNFSISNITYFQPLLTDFSEFRLSSQTSLNFVISKRLTYSSTFNITNDTRVPENVPATYYSLKNVIRWNF